MAKKEVAVVDKSIALNSRLQELNDIAEEVTMDDVIPPYLKLNKVDELNPDINTKHRIHNSTLNTWYDSKEGVDVILLGYTVGRKRAESDGKNFNELCGSRDGFFGYDKKQEKKIPCATCPYYGYDSGYEPYCKNEYHFVGLFAKDLRVFYMTLSYNQFKPFKKIMNAFLLDSRKKVYNNPNDTRKTEWFWLKMTLRGKMDGSYGQWVPEVLVQRPDETDPVMKYMHPENEELLKLTSAYIEYKAAHTKKNIDADAEMPF